VRSGPCFSSGRIAHHDEAVLHIGDVRPRELAARTPNSFAKICCSCTAARTPNDWRLKGAAV